MYLAHDRLRDDLSVGVYYFWVDREVPPTGHFSVDVFEDENVLFIDIFDGNKLVALVGAIFFPIFISTYSLT